MSTHFNEIGAGAESAPLCGLDAAKSAHGISLVFLMSFSKSAAKLCTNSKREKDKTVHVCMPNHKKKKRHNLVYVCQLTLMKSARAWTRGVCSGV